ncbi:uncharacterized protein LOC143033093 [Oratosquilla oratoria]|uniref:uncharacterized protein LOC143033093 n=1 Tax=Oratosquilla oratoria TaxID=337810 RepID=UPI003F75B7DC
MGDINEGVNGSSLSSFGDDTSLSLPITSTEDVPNLQRDLDTVYAWASRNNMVFNEEKIEILRHGQHQEIKTNTKLLTEGGHEISLGEDCAFHHHIAETVRRARGITGWVLRNFSIREPKIMLTLWNTMIQPLLDYCSQLWSPHKRGEIQQLEAVQRSYTRQIRGMRDLNYYERLKKLGLYSQQRRRDHVESD